MTEARIEKLYSDFKEFVNEEAKTLKQIDVHKARNSKFVGLFGITEEDYAFNFELAESLKRITKHPFPAELLNHIESTGMRKGETVSQILSTPSEYLAAFWSERGSHSPGLFVLDYVYQPESHGSFPHLDMLFLLNIERTASGYELTLNNGPGLLWSVDDLLRRKGTKKAQ